MNTATATENDPRSTLGWDSCEFDGDTVPLLYWVARAIFTNGCLDLLPDGRG